LQGRVKRRRGSTFLFGLIHLGLIYTMGYLLILTILPGLALVGAGFYFSGPGLGAAAAFAAAPVSIVCYLFLVLAVKWVAIGRILPGVYLLHSRDYLRYWFLNYLLNNTRNIALALYATMFLPKFLKLLGARIGRGVEISTAMHIMPDLLEIAEGSFLADACIVGGHKTYQGRIELCSNKIGKRSFVGNSAMVPAGIDVGDNGLIGVMSTPPTGVIRTADGTRWLGSPGFELPNTQKFNCFSSKRTFEPGYGLVFSRAAVETLRLLLPGFVAAANLVLFCMAITLAYQHAPLWVVALLAPATALILSFVSIFIVALVKVVLIDRFEPTVKPLWCSFVWLNEVVNGLYESIAAAAMAPLMGTPFISTCLRIMGCKIGKWVFIETTLFSEFDLVEIGDYASLNLGSTIQSHLFEDRVMKADYLKIGEGCTVGNMAVVLYGTEMKRGSSLGALSVLMKGEVLPEFTNWIGIPTRPVEAVPLAAFPEAKIAPARVAPMALDARFGESMRESADNEMSFAPWLFTASLVLIAISASVGIIWWAMATVPSRNFYSPGPSAESVPHAAAAKKSDRAAANASEPIESRFSGWEGLFNRKAMISILPEDFAENQTADQRNQQPNQPRAAPPISLPDLDEPETKSTLPQAPAEGRKLRLPVLKADRSTPKSHKMAVRPTYVEKLVEQGDAGEIRFRYVRRNCTPPNMVDVCFMAAANRRSIVVQRW
jgi:carbonic anhydrase/acetyltransferase-like protein (isoleucine patch superfamily)